MGKMDTIIEESFEGSLPNMSYKATVTADLYLLELLVADNAPITLLRKEGRAAGYFELFKIARGYCFEGESMVESMRASILEQLNLITRDSAALMLAQQMAGNGALSTNNASNLSTDLDTVNDELAEAASDGEALDDAAGY